jgi:hypothetical protein
MGVLLMCVAYRPASLVCAGVALVIGSDLPVRAQSLTIPEPAGGADASAAPTPAGSAPVESPSPWTGSLELYGFGPLRITGDTTVRGFTADTDLSLGDVLPSLEFAFSLRGAVERDRVGLLTDLNYVRTGTEKARTITTAGGDGFSGQGSVSTELGVYDLALRYRFGDRETALGQPGQFSVIPYAGVRLVQAALTVKADLNNGQRVREGTLDRVWAQPLLGTQASVFLAPRLRAFARADIAGFGLSGSRDLSGNAQLGLGYAIGNSTDLNLSWRYFGINYDNGKSRNNGFSSYQNGIELGVKFFF